ncbi:mechanosensitive channel MscK [Haemophilus haemoglobinophilus]|nr:mechanosensitive channel MscK [Canicola haemoglobinophilus]
MKIKNKLKQLAMIGLFAWSQFALAGTILSEADVKIRLDEAKSADQSLQENKSAVQNLEETLALLAKIAKQKDDNLKLQKLIQNAPNEQKSVREEIAKLKNTPENYDFAKFSMENLQADLAKIQADLQQVQVGLAQVNAQLVNQRSASERAQSALSANLARSQEIDKLSFNVDIDRIEQNKLSTESVLIELQNQYNQNLLQGNNELTALYTLQLEFKNLAQQHLQAKQTALQTEINSRKLAETEQQAEQLKQAQKETEGNPLLVQQQQINIQIGQELVTQTSKLNTLSQDSLRIKSVLDNLQQTERNINEQISALQGTLVLSKIINKQKQLLPQDQMITGLSKQIADLRVKIFDLTELRDSLYDVNDYIANLEKRQGVTLEKTERAQLTQILQERQKGISDLVSILNNQLNLSINIELNQKQVSLISDTLQGKLQQQSFWVKSNAPIDLDWLKRFPTLLKMELEDIREQFNFNNWKDNIISVTALIVFLLALAFFISWRKERIKQRLNYINSKINTLKGDKQLYTPEAIFWTIILCLPMTLFVLVGLIVITFICFNDPEKFWWWSLRMSGYWLLFAFMLAMFRPNGIAYRHFNIPKQNVELFSKVMNRSVWISVLWLNASMFTTLDGGITNDVIGQLMTIAVLVISLLIVGPRMRYAVQAYEKSSEKSLLLKAFRIVLLVSPIILIVLVVLGYYYTTLNLMDHLMSSYFALMIWLVARNMVYRGFAVSARRLAYRRLQEKREQLQAQSQDVAVEEEFSVNTQEEVLAISAVKDQVLRVTDLALLVGLIGLFYWVWSDLITVAYYLEGVTLWKQIVTTEAGTITEAITLWNLLLALIILSVTYALVRNIGGVLEVLVFSRFNFSQGTPYTITTLLTYFIIAIGSGVAFSTLGMSWSKLQWLFAALSVGLGFGLQEIFANFVSGIIILFERPVRIGDVVTIGDFSGTVSKIRIRSTTIIDFDKKEVIVPNKAFVTERIVNWALTNSMTRVVISVGVAYGSDLELVRTLLLQAANETPAVLKEPEPSAYFLTFGASTLDHELRVYVGKISDRVSTQDFLNRRINELFAEHNIEIAFNQLDVFIKNQATNEEVKVLSENLQG